MSGAGLPRLRLVARLDSDVGGFRGFTLLLARACLMAGAPEVEICAPDALDLSDEERALLGTGAHVRRLTRSLPPLKDGVELVQIANTSRFAPLLDRLVDHGGVALLHELQPTHMIAGTRHAVAAFSEAHGPLIGRLMAQRMAVARPAARERLASSAHVLPFILRHADGAIVHSRYAQILARAAAPGLWVGRAFLIANDAALFDEAGDIVASSKVPGRPPTIALVGSHTASKSSLEAVEELNRLAAQGLRFKVRIAGEISPPLERRFKAALAELARLVPVEAALGRVAPSLHRHILAESDLVLTLRRRSLGESSGVAAEAFAHGACVVACDIDAFSELPRATVAWVRPHGDDEMFRASLAETLARCLAHPEEIDARRAAIGREQFSLRAYAHSYSELLRTLPRNRRASRGEVESVTDAASVAELKSVPNGQLARVSANACQEAQSALGQDSLASFAARELSAGPLAAALWRLGFERDGALWRRVGKQPACGATSINANS